MPPAGRIATFDNDGTLWCEQPLQTQFFFAFDRVKQLAAQGPDNERASTVQGRARTRLQYALRTRQTGAVRTGFRHPRGHNAMRSSTRLRADGSRRRSIPKFGRLFKECTYRPQVELLAYLRENGFKTYIVSAGGVDFMRAFAEEAYGIPREQVIGSSVKLRYDLRDNRVSLVKLPELNSFGDREVKALNIGLHIGRRPLLAFGNSDGDLP